MRQTVRSLRFAGTGAATLLLLSGCMTAKLEEDRTMSTSIGATEAVVLLAKPHVEGITAEDDFMDCVGDKMAKSTGIQVRPNDLFVDSMFPWLEPSTAPQRPEGITKLLSKDVVAARVAESGVRYLIWIDGATRQTDSGGSITCTLGPAGGGCIGFGWWEKESDYQAIVWDLEYREDRGLGIDQRHRHFGPGRRARAAAVHRARAGHGLRPAGRPVGRLLERRQQHHGPCPCGDLSPGRHPAGEPLPGAGLKL